MLANQFVSGWSRGRQEAVGHGTVRLAFEEGPLPRPIRAGTGPARHQDGRLVYRFECIAAGGAGLWRTLELGLCMSRPIGDFERPATVRAPTHTPRRRAGCLHTQSTFANQDRNTHGRPHAVRTGNRDVTFRLVSSNHDNCK